MLNAEPVRRKVKLGKLQFDVTFAGPEAGEVVLLLHGFPQDSKMWYPIMRLLATRGFRVIAPDQRGYSQGAQPRGVSHYCLRMLATDVELLVSEFSPTGVHIMGHDWGGSVVWQIAALRPDLIHSAVVLSMPHPKGLLRGLERIDQLRRSWYLIPVCSVPLMKTFLHLHGGVIALTWLKRLGMTPDEAGLARGLLSRPGVLRGALSYYQALPWNFAYRKDVGDIEVPVMYIWGENDPTISRRSAQSTQMHVSGPYTFTVIANGGHWLIDNNYSETAAAVLAHLAAVTSQA